jgi:hypothetical protein
MSRNDACTDLTRSILTVQVVPETASQPLHPANPESIDGVASRITVVPNAYDSEQSEPQLIPAGVEVTVPAPSPDLVTVSAKFCRLNVAATDLTALMVTVHVEPETVAHPVQPMKVEPRAGEAVSVTAVPLA